MAILAAEEIYKTENKTKLLYAQTRIWKEANKAGIPLSKNQVNLLLEGTLRELKLNLNQHNWNLISRRDNIPISSTTN